MNKKKSTSNVGQLCLVLISLAVMGCSLKATTKSKTEEPAGFGPGASGSLPTREVKEVILNNGLKIFFVSDTKIPIVHMNLLVKAGSVHDQEGKEGALNLAFSLLGRGTQKKNFTALSDDLTRIGGSFDSSSGVEYSSLSMEMLSIFQMEGLNEFYDILTIPAYQQFEIDRQIAQNKDFLKKKKDNPSVVAEDLMQEIILGAHPYARESIGTLDSLSKIRKIDIVKNYYRFVRPENSVLAVSGYFNEDFKVALIQKMSQWKKGSQIPEISLPKLQARTGQVRVVTKADLKQAQIRAGRIGFARDNTNRYLQFKVINEVLGGSFSSRLMKRIRVEKGLTYSISSSSSFLKNAGLIEISTFTKNESAKAVVEEIKDVLKTFWKDGITDEELRSAKAQIIGQFPRAIETPEQWAANYLYLDFYGISKDYLATHNAKMNELTLQEINQTIKETMNPDYFDFVVYGNTSL